MSARLPFFAVVLLPALARAQSQAPSQDVGGSLFQLLFGLVVVVALLFASLWLLKRLAAPRGEAAGLLRVVAGAAVGTRERVVIVEIGPTWLVLGVAPGSVTALAEVPRSSLPPAAEAPPAKDFAGRLSQILNRRHAP
jgi:flagellar protein FliO/FliZ